MQKLSWQSMPGNWISECFTDLHIHIGRTMHQRAVKITASNNLTLSTIIHESMHRKGMQMVGIIDCHSPEVQEEIDLLIEQGVLLEMGEGGLKYEAEHGELTVIMGVEIEVRLGKGNAHFLCYFPDRESIRSFLGWYQLKVTNVYLSTQRLYSDAQGLLEETLKHGGIMFPAHAFTPYKSVYGACVDSLIDHLDLAKIPAIELGLSSDSSLANGVEELRDKTFLTNSDAHSLQKIAREYQDFRVKKATFQELVLALWRREGRGVKENYGLHPQLGKYYRSRCLNCMEILADPSVLHCPFCGKEGTKGFVKGVLDRFKEISHSHSKLPPAHRPPYIHQIPLEFVPGIGPGRLRKLLDSFGTEMNILHHVPLEQLAMVVGMERAKNIDSSRKGKLSFSEGGGGVYGKIHL